MNFSYELVIHTIDLGKASKHVAHAFINFKLAVFHSLFGHYWVAFSQSDTVGDNLLLNFRVDLLEYFGLGVNFSIVSMASLEELGIEDPVFSIGDSVNALVLLKMHFEGLFDPCKRAIRMLFDKIRGEGIAKMIQGLFLVWSVELKLCVF